jgi:predicted glutamine amidotransferase
MRFAAALIFPILIFLGDGPVTVNTAYHSYAQSQFQKEVNENQQHDCCLWAVISNGLPDSVLYKNLVMYPSSLKNLASWGNVDGWGIACYSDFYVQPDIFRSARRAYTDTFFDQTVLSLDTSACRILLAHIRHCTVGCCCHGCDNITDPHPFQRFKHSKHWTFIHNGTIQKPILLDLIGEEYLTLNPPDGSGIPECDPSDSSNVTDSELFFLFLLKGIEDANWQTSDGIRNALIELINRSSGAELNFILSDGHDLRAFRRGNDLSYLYNSLDGYSAVATYFPDSVRGNWQVVQEYELIHIQPGAAPQSENLRAYLPPVVTCPGDTSLLYVLARPVCLQGFTVDDPDNNLDTVIVNQGSYYKGQVCFNPNPGINTIIVTAIDGYGNSDHCSTIIDATLSDPGYLSGLVTDSSSTPLAGAIVTMREIIDSTGSDGRYFISDIVPGLYAVQFSLPGYTDSTVANVPISANDTTIINVALQAGCRYIAGDANGDGHLNGLDVIYSVSYFKGGPPPPFECNCPVWGRFYSAADANGSCNFNGLDVTYSVAFFKGLGPAPLSCPDCQAMGR